MNWKLIGESCTSFSILFLYGNCNFFGTSTQSGKNFTYNPVLVNKSWLITTFIELTEYKKMWDTYRHTIWVWFVGRFFIRIDFTWLTYLTSFRNQIDASENTIQRISKRKKSSSTYYKKVIFVRSYKEFEKISESLKNVENLHY